jgi:hypothetical protein
MFGTWTSPSGRVNMLACQGLGAGLRMPLCRRLRPAIPSARRARQRPAPRWLQPAIRTLTRFRDQADQLQHLDELVDRHDDHPAHQVLEAEDDDTVSVGTGERGARGR